MDQVMHLLKYLLKSTASFPFVSSFLLPFYLTLYMYSVYEIFDEIL